MIKSFSNADEWGGSQNAVDKPEDESSSVRRDTPKRSLRSAAEILSDVQLLEALTSGSDAGFKRFYQQFASALFSLTCSILRDAKEAEDVLQDAFVQMWKQSSSYDPTRSSLLTWTVMIARSRAIDRVRKRQRARDKSAAAIAEAAVAPVLMELGPDDDLMRNEERDRVRAFLPSLPSAQREALDLAFFGSLTQREISQKLDVPLGTVKARIRRGLMALRSRIHSPVVASDLAPASATSP